MRFYFPVETNAHIPLPFQHIRQSRYCLTGKFRTAPATRIKTAKARPIELADFTVPRHSASQNRIMKNRKAVISKKAKISFYGTRTGGGCLKEGTHSVFRKPATRSPMSLNEMVVKLRHRLLKNLIHLADLTNAGTRLCIKNMNVVTVEGKLDFCAPGVIHNS